MLRYWWKYSLWTTVLHPMRKVISCFHRCLRDVWPTWPHNLVNFEYSDGHFNLQSVSQIQLTYERTFIWMYGFTGNPSHCQFTRVIDRVKWARDSNFWEFERAGPPSSCKGEEQSWLTSPSLLSSIMNGPPCQEISGYPSTSSSFTHSANKLLNAGDG